MSRPTPRLHRLPQRTDYVLIPAPLDLSLPDVAEKSPLPAVIVTPSSPISPRDFSIAFLATPAKPTLRSRFLSKTPFSNASMRTRFMMLLLFILFVLVCHLVTHRLAVRLPYLDMSVQTGDVHYTEVPTATPVGWFSFLFPRAAEAIPPPPESDLLAMIQGPTIQAARG